MARKRTDSEQTDFLALLEWGSMTHVAVVLSGCGFLDGAEIRESVFALLALDQEGASVQCFAPDKPQMHVVNHLTGETTPGETRNVLVEAARIARGEIMPTSKFVAGDFDALIFPGGYGAAKNLSNFATEGPAAIANDDVAAMVKAMHDAGKPVGFICIAPAAVGAAVLGTPDNPEARPRLTIGDDKGTAEAVEKLGAHHVTCDVSDAVLDPKFKIASTPAYMDGGARPGQVYDGIRKMVQGVLAMAGDA